MAIIVACDKVAIAYVTKEPYEITTWLDALWSCLVFPTRVHEIDWFDLCVSRRSELPQQIQL